MKEEINNFWQIQTPERVENLPSPPYVIVKNEYDEIKSNQYPEYIIS